MTMTLDGTLGITATGSLTGLTTPITAAQGGTGAATLTANNVLLGNGTSAVTFVAPSTSGNLLTSNGTAWVSSAPAAAGPVLKLVTDSTDIAVTALAPTYSTIGSSFSVSIPTTGLIRLSSFVGRINNNSTTNGGGPTFGIRIGSTNYWLALLSDNGTDRYYLGVGEIQASAYITSNGGMSTNAGAMYAKPQCLDIAYNSVPTGTQTVQLICAKTTASYVDNFTIKGTTITTKIGIEFVSAS